MRSIVSFQHERASTADPRTITRSPWVLVPLTDARNRDQSRTVSVRGSWSHTIYHGVVRVMISRATRAWSRRRQAKKHKAKLPTKSVRTQCPQHGVRCPLAIGRKTRGGNRCRLLVIRSGPHEKRVETSTSKTWSERRRRKTTTAASNAYSSRHSSATERTDGSRSLFCIRECACVLVSCCGHCNDCPLSTSYIALERSTDNVLSVWNGKQVRNERWPGVFRRGYNLLADWSGGSVVVRRENDSSDDADRAGTSRRAGGKDLSWCAKRTAIWTLPVVFIYIHRRHLRHQLTIHLRKLKYYVI